MARMILSVCFCAPRSDGGRHVVCSGEKRVSLRDYIGGYPFLAAQFEIVEEPEQKTPEIDARLSALKARALEELEYIPGVPEALVLTIVEMESPGRLADLAAYMTDRESSEKQEVLETIDLKARLDRMFKQLTNRLEVLKLSRTLGLKTEAALSKQQREHVLRQQLREIQKELGEANGENEELTAFRSKIEAAGMPKEVRDKARREFARLERLPDISSEYGMLRTYLETLAELPWAPPEPKSIDIGGGVTAAAFSRRANTPGAWAACFSRSRAILRPRIRTRNQAHSEQRARASPQFLCEERQWIRRNESQVFSRHDENQPHGAGDSDDWLRGRQVGGSVGLGLGIHNSRGRTCDGDATGCRTGRP